MHKRHLTAPALLASALVLTACGTDSTDTTGSTGTAGGSTGTSSTAAPTIQGNDADIAFLTGMKPHHEQAVEMSEMVLAANPPAEVAVIAEQIKGAQGPEIEQITTMLAELGEDTIGGGHSMGTGGGTAGEAGHGGMMSDAMITELDAATGTEAARLYLQGMVEHHQGAIQASDKEIADGQYEPAIALAKTIKTAQTDEIAEMQALLTSL